jgi:hypothetical protein
MTGGEQEGLETIEDPMQFLQLAPFCKGGLHAIDQIAQCFHGSGLGGFLLEGIESFAHDVSAS